MTKLSEEANALDFRLTDVSLRYATGTYALAPIDMTVARGEFVSLLGPSGCGKSTLLRVMAGLLEPSMGTVETFRDAQKAFVFQDATLLPWRSAVRNAQLLLELEKVPRTQWSSRVRGALELVGLTGFERAHPSALSGGMRMRLSLARALALDPEIFFMDEPFGALDEITRHKLDADLLELWQKKNLTVVFVTHSIHESVFLSSRVVMMAARPGRIVEEFRIDEPYPRRPEFMVSTDFSHHAKNLQDSLHRASRDTQETAEEVRA